MKSSKPVKNLRVLQIPFETPKLNNHTHEESTNEKYPAIQIFLWLSIIQHLATLESDEKEDTADSALFTKITAYKVHY